MVLKLEETYPALRTGAGVALTRVSVVRDDAGVVSHRDMKSAHLIRRGLALGCQGRCQNIETDRGAGWRWR